MGWLGLIKGLLSVTRAITEYARDKNLMDAGAAKSTLEGIKQADESILKANRARKSVNHSTDSVSGDANNRNKSE